jgi:hypothetical protein
MSLVGIAAARCRCRAEEIDMNHDSDSSDDDRHDDMAEAQTAPEPPRFWINTVSLDHVRIGAAGGFVQADHGAPTRLRWLRRGDSIVMYSPRVGMRAGAAVQAFTALGTILDDEPVQVRLGLDVEPWRRQVSWQPCATADVRPLLDQLTFVVDKKQWGFAFRRGLFRIDAADFARIAAAMAPAGSTAERTTATASLDSGAA